MSKTKQTYIGILKKYGIQAEALLEQLGEELFTSPASTSTDLNYAFDGGLVGHLIKVAAQAVKMNENSVPAPFKQDPVSVVKVAMFCEIGKVGRYKPLNSKWHNDKGIMYEFKDGDVAMRVGQRSVYLLQKAGIQLSEAEFQAIINHDVQDDSMIQWHCEPLTRLVKQAIDWAIAEEKYEYKNSAK